MKKIGVIGAGTMGAGIIQSLGQGGYEVLFVETDEKRKEMGEARIAKALDKLASKGRISEGEAADIKARIKGSCDMNDLADRDVVIEAALEDMDAKKEIFAALGDICEEDTVLATNTSALSITEIASACSAPDRVIGMHFFNPVPVMKLVEVISGLSTSDETREKTISLAESIGKEPVKVEEAPGFVVNRILIPMINEATGILADGVADAEGIDKAMKLGANFPMGPLALGDLIGLDVCLAIMETLHREYGDDKYRPHVFLRKMVRDGKLGRKTGEGFFRY